MSKPIPPGAHQIAQARQRGLRPACDVIVSFVGQTPWDGVHVFPKPGISYDWEWSEHLPITIVLAPGIDAWSAIAGCFWPTDPDRFLRLIDIERKSVAHVISLIPKPVLWHCRDVKDYFTEEELCN